MRDHVAVARSRRIAFHVGVNVHHGIRESDIPQVMAHLGIASHDAEDCHLTTIMQNALSRMWYRAVAVMVEGRSVYVTTGDAWIRWMIPAAERRRILAGDVSSRVTLEPATGIR